MKKRVLTEIKDVLKNAVNENFYKYGFKVLLLKDNWKIIVGDKLSFYTSPEMIKHKTLIVHCIHQGWINTLQFHKNQILDAIKDKFDNYFMIDDIIFKFGKIEKKEDFTHKTNIIKEDNDNNNIIPEISLKIESKDDLVKQLKKYFEICDKNKI